VFAAIEQAIGDGSSASVSYVDFRLDHHIARKAVSPSLKLLDRLGLIDIECTIDEVEAVRLAALAREVKPHRTFERRRECLVKSPDTELKPVKPPPPKPMAVERPRIMQRRVPSDVLRSSKGNTGRRRPERH
jgi:hypothetical protein